MDNCIIIGGGPAGLMCAYLLEKENISYKLLEKNNQLGKKLLISGNGRCNVTNNKQVEDFIDDLTIKNNKFLYSMLYTFGPNQVKEFFKEHGIPFILENNLKYFPKTNKASSILKVFTDHIKDENISYNQHVTKIEKENELFLVHTKHNIFKTKMVVVATGSNSFPKTGSTGDGLLFAKDFMIHYQPFTPAETHVYSKNSVTNMADLKGVSYKNVTVTIENTRISHKGDILFTHFGLSGPVIYHLSEFIYEEVNKKNSNISINFTGESKEYIKDSIKKDRVSVKEFIRRYLTKKHSTLLLNQLRIDKEFTYQLSNDEIEKIINYLTNYLVRIDKVEEKENSYVNKGGILTTELNPQTMEAKKVTGLYFIGETTNIHGPIGGYNITIAFGSGYICGLDIIEKIGGNHENI
jgi:predicted Rossmann fold flavoprotein